MQHADEPVLRPGGGLVAVPAPAELVRLRLDLGYDGTGFAGWAVQPGLRTVQGEVELALGRVLRLPGAPRTACAGRTDTGVHARGQVAHSDVPAAAWAAVSARGGQFVLRRLHGALPPDLAHRRGPAPDGFDARWSARSRSYSYRVSDGPAGPDPLLRSWVLHHRGDRGAPLDLEAMNHAAQDLLGEHDFAASAGAGTAAARYGPCTGCTGRDPPTAPTRAWPCCGCGPTPSATRWCGCSSVPCSRSARAAHPGSVR